VGVFRRRRKHNPAVIYVLDRRADYVPYYSAVCQCGWFAEPVDAPAYPDHEIERVMAAAAAAHDPNADTNVGFPLDEPT
jgi:hypothetical protein